MSTRRPPTCTPLLEEERESLAPQLAELGFGAGRARLRLQLRRLEPGDRRAGRGRGPGQASSRGVPGRRRARPRPSSTTAATASASLRRAHRGGPARGQAGRPPLHQLRRPALTATRPPGRPAASRMAGAIGQHGGVNRTAHDRRRGSGRGRRSSPSPVRAHRGHPAASRRGDPLDHPARDLPRRGGPGVRRRHGQAGRAPHPQPDQARRPVRHADPAGAADPGGARRLRLRQAGAGQLRPSCAIPATRGCWSAWPARPPTCRWPRLQRLLAARGPPCRPGVAVVGTWPVCSCCRRAASCVLFGYVNVLPGRVQPDPHPARSTARPWSSGPAPALVAGLAASCGSTRCRVLLLIVLLRPGARPRLQPGPPAVPGRGVA